jgi:GH15 family glucan-1,4-alpha-glucosidase
MAQRIEDYALIGDTQTAALVGRNGSIDWLCVPRFDSGAVFAALLGDRNNGHWLIAPAGGLERVERKYIENTLVLETTFHTDDGVVRITDCMPIRGKSVDIVRMVEGISGRVPMHMDMTIRFDYGSIVPWVGRGDDNTLHAVAGPDAISFRTSVHTHGADKATVADFVVSAGEKVPFILAYHQSHVTPPRALDAERAIKETARWWRKWARQCVYDGKWQEAVMRSLITLKALTYEPTGGIVAAPTTSLPEWIGSVRNWDYRYCWLRDATLTLSSMTIGGYTEEALAWRDWLVRAAAGDPEDLQIMYGPGGERRLTEYTLDWLDGYEHSTPVRVGNAASEQFQLDVYGEVLSTLYQTRSLIDDGNHQNSWPLEIALLTALEELWRHPDDGIWEVRGPRQHFTHSKVMAWLAFDRAVANVEEFGLDGPVERWRSVRDEIHQQICDEAWDSELNAFTQAYGSKKLDAAVLMMPIIGFLPGNDPRIVGTVEAIEQKLLFEGFVARYETSADGAVDGLPAGEGVFLPCSFWLADNLAMIGRVDDAVALFERLVALVNDVGLLSEEYDGGERRQLGNFPQAFTHVCLVNTAAHLSSVLPRVSGGAEEST